MLDSAVSQAIARREAVLVIDPKGEPDCRDALKRRCEAIGQPQRFVMFHPGSPNNIRINPLSNFTRGAELAVRIAGVSTSAEVEEDPHSCFATMVLTSIVNAMLMVGEKPNLVAINRYMAHGVQDLLKRALVEWSRRRGADWQGKTEACMAAAPVDAKVDALVRFYREQAHTHGPSVDIDNLLNVYEHDREHMHKMAAPLMPVLAALSAGAIGPLLSPDPDDAGDPREIGDLARLIESASVFYVGLDTLPDHTVGAAIASMILADLATLVRHRQKASRPGPPVNLLVEHDPETVNAAVVRALDRARIAGVRIQFDA